MNNDLWDEPTLAYVGRRKHHLGLGNPWGISQARQVIYPVNTKKEAIDKYRQWFLGKAVKNYISGLHLIGLEFWETEYMVKVVALAKSIQQGECTSLGCWCIDILNYTLVSDGAEKCHAEILYKGCLQLIEYWEESQCMSA